MYIISIKNKLYFALKSRIFFILIFDCLIILSFSGCPGFDLLFPSVGSSKESEGRYSNTTTSNTMDKDAKKFPVDMEIEIEEYEEVDSLKKSDIVFVGKSDVQNDYVYFRKDFIDLLKANYTNKLSSKGKIKDDLIDYMIMFYHSRKHDKSFLKKKKIKVSPVTKVEQLLNDLAYAQNSEYMRLHLFSKKEDVIDSLFKHYTGRDFKYYIGRDFEHYTGGEMKAKNIVDFGKYEISFEEFQYKVQIGVYHNYERYLRIYNVTNNDAILLVYDVNDKSSFDDLNKLVDYFSENNSKHIFFILGDQSSSAGDVDIIDNKFNSASTDSNEIFNDDYVSKWCKKKAEEINKNEK